MAVTKRAYRPDDYEPVYQFLTETFRHARHPNWEPERWEYCFHHGMMDTDNQHQWGIWEEDGHIVGMVHYEWHMGEVCLEWHPDYQHLREEMLDWADAHLVGTEGDLRGSHRLFIDDYDDELAAIATARGYVREGWAEPLSMMVIPDPFPTIPLPDGFKVQSLADENDLVKVDRALWRGFNHEGEPHSVEEGVEWRKKMQSTPNFRKELNMVVVAPDGWYVSYAGLWYNSVHKYGYVEPVATDPTYRMMGLGKAAVMEGVRQTALLGAKVAYVGSDQVFYQRMGFHVVNRRNAWMKKF